MTNNVGMTMRQSRPTYLSNTGMGSVMGGVNALMGGGGNVQNMLGGTKKRAKSMGDGTMSTMPVGPAVPVSPGVDMSRLLGGGMGGMTGGQAPSAPVNMRSAVMPNPMPINPTPQGRGGVTLLGRPMMGMFGRGRFG